jgi:hypothetical protein
MNELLEWWEETAYIFSQKVSFAMRLLLTLTCRRRARRNVRYGR